MKVRIKSYNGHNNRLWMWGCTCGKSQDGWTTWASAMYQAAIHQGDIHSLKVNWYSIRLEISDWELNTFFGD